MDKQYIEDLCNEKILPYKNDYIESIKHRAKPKYKGKIWCVDPITYNIKTFRNNSTAYLMGYYCFTEERFAFAHKKFNLETDKVINIAMEESFKEKIESFVDVKDFGFGDQTTIYMSGYSDKIPYNKVKLKHDGFTQRITL